MSLSDLLQEGLLDYVQEIDMIRGKLRVVFGGYGENEVVFEVVLSMFYAESLGFIVAETQDVVVSESFALDDPSPAAMFYWRLSVIEYNRRNYCGLTHERSHEFNCRDRQLFNWGEYSW